MSSEISKYNLFSGLEGLEGKELFYTLAKQIYWFITFVVIFIGLFKALEAGYQIVKKSSGGSPAYALVEHKQEIWDYIRGIVFLSVGLVLIGALVSAAQSAGWFV